jgi:hypothetical protein
LWANDDRNLLIWCSSLNWLCYHAYAQLSSHEHLPIFYNNVFPLSIFFFIFIQSTLSITTHNTPAVKRFICFRSIINWKCRFFFAVYCKSECMCICDWNCVRWKTVDLRKLIMEVWVLSCDQTFQRNLNLRHRDVTH